MAGSLDYIIIKFLVMANKVFFLGTGKSDESASASDNHLEVFPFRLS